jgi:hypothetical protein
VQTAAARVMPDQRSASAMSKMTEPGSAD